MSTSGHESRSGIGLLDGSAGAVLLSVDPEETTAGAEGLVLTILAYDLVWGDGKKDEGLGMGAAGWDVKGRCVGWEAIVVS